MGSVPPSPSNPDNTTNKYHFELLKGQLGIDDSDFDTALATGTTTLWKVPDYSQKWGFMVAGTCEVEIKRREDGNYNVTFKLKDKKLMSPKSFIYPYKNGQRPLEYKGPVEDKTEVMKPEELEDMMVVPFKGGGMSPGAMGGGMGMGGPASSGPPGLGMGAPAGGPAGPPGG